MKTWKIALAATALSLGVACASSHSEVDEHFGNAVRANRAAMIENPEPTRTARGLDPNTAEHVVENYDEGQKAQEHGKAMDRRTTGIVIGDFQ